jgi:hypothetical protein
MKLVTKYQISAINSCSENKASVTNQGPHSVSIWLVRRNSFYFSYYSKYMNLLHKSLFADLRFVSIFLWQTKRIREIDPSLMRPIIEMLSKWRHPSIVDRILKSISFPYPT